jgi:hypothetical protein
MVRYNRDGCLFRENSAGTLGLAWGRTPTLKALVIHFVEQALPVNSSLLFRAI